MLNVKREYKDLQEEVLENRKLIEKLKGLYAQAQQEVKDMREES